METKLNNVANICSGYSFRTRLDPSNDGNISVIQIGDVNKENGLLPTANLIRIKKPPASVKNYIQTNDIVFSPRGEKILGILIKEDMENTIIAAPLMCIRIQNPHILPEYLCWFLNSPKAKSYLLNHAKGSFIKTVDKTTIENIEVMIPTMSFQYTIAAIFHLAIREKQLIIKLHKLYEIYRQERIMNFMLKHAEG